MKTLNYIKYAFIAIVSAAAVGCTVYAYYFVKNKWVRDAEEKAQILAVLGNIQKIHASLYSNVTALKLNAPDDKYNASALIKIIRAKLSELKSESKALPTDDSEIKSVKESIDELIFSVEKLNYVYEIAVLNQVSDTPNEKIVRDLQGAKADLNLVGYLYNGYNDIVESKFNKSVGDAIILLKEPKTSENYAQTLLWLTLGSGLCVLGISLMFVWIIAGKTVKLQRDIQSLGDSLHDIVRGDYKSDVAKVSDEFVPLREIVVEIKKSLDGVSMFIGKLGEGRWEEIKIESHEDAITQLLINVKNRLVEVSRAERIRNWMISGVAQFSDLIKVSDNVQKLCDSLISSLSKYIEANMGAIYVGNFEELEKDELHPTRYTMISSYAYNKSKYGLRTFGIGEGFVGQAAREKEAISIVDLPEEYIMLTSGLGEAKPKSLLVVPLVYNDVVYGVLEFASILNFKEHQTEFVTKFSETIAIALNNLYSRSRTLKLLSESQKLSAELQKNQSELVEKSNRLEEKNKELLSTQLELTGQLSALNNSAIVSETDVAGTITFVNDTFVQVSRYERNRLIGENHRLLKTNEFGADYFKLLWDTILSGKVWRGEFKNKTRDGSFYWVDATITPVLSSEGKILKFISVQFEITIRKIQDDQIRIALDESMAKEEELRQNAEEMEAAAEEMRRTQIELSGLINAMHNSAIVSEADLQGRIININEQFVVISRYSREELIGQNHRILKSGHQPDDMFEILWSNISSGKVWRGEFKNRSKENNFYWVSATITPVLDSTKRPIKYISVAFDITAQKYQEEQIRAALEISQAQEQELRQNAEELQQAHEEMRKTQIELRGQIGALNNAGVVSETDLKGNITFVNEAFILLTGYSQDELIGKNHRILKSNEHSDEFYIEFWETIRNGKIWSNIFINLNKFGQKYYVKSTITPVLGFDGKPVKYIGVSFDISAQIEQERRIEEALIKSLKQEEILREQQVMMQEAQLELQGNARAINSSSIVLETEVNGTIIFVNDELCNISGYYETELIGQTPAIFNSRTHHEGFFIHLWNTILAGKVWKGEITNKSKNGELYWVATTISPVKDIQGNLKKFICIQYDISRIVKKEIELRRALELAEFQAQEIRNKQAQLDSIFSNISGAIYRRNKEHKIIFVSEYIAKITGYDVEDFISGNLDFGQLIHDDDRENYHAIIAEMLRNGMSFSVVYRIFNKSNELVWVREDGSGVYDDNNEIQFIDGVLINITIEKQLEDSLRDSLVELEDKQNKMREYAHILEVQKIELNGRIGALNNCGIVSETDLQGNIIFINEEATRVWGYEFDEVVGKPHNIIKSNEHTDDFFKSLWNTISVGNVWKGELKNLAKDGSDFWVQLTITPVLDSEGNPLKYIGVGFEITRIKRQSIRIKELFNESKKQEDELRKQSQQLKELHREMLATQTELTGQISAINNAALVSEADTDGKILFLNDEAVTVWGYAREEVVGRKHNILKSGYHNAEFYQSIWDSITVGKVWKGQVCNKAKDGSLFWIELTITPVLDANGVPIKYIGVSFEITKQKIQSQRIKDALALSEKSESELRAKIVKLENTIKNYEIAHEHKTLANETFNANVPLPKRTVESNSLKIIKEYMNSIVSNVMIFEFNSDGRISDLNNTFINKMSVDKSTVLDKPFTVLFSPETPHSKVMEIVKELKGNLVWSGKVELLSKTNGTVNCMLKIFPYTDESGEFKKFICIVLEEEKKVLYAMS
jgi:PAS domain S-box-containing protein